MKSSFFKVGKLAVATGVVLAGSLSVQAVFAHQSETKEKCAFVPENNLYIAEGGKAAAGLDEITYNRVIDKVASFYEPIVKEKGGILKVNRLWKNGTVNASAERSGSEWIVNMYGGMARHFTMTPDGFSLVMCHELGHHLGGFPRKGNHFAANEGQSDYFATMKCLRRVFENDDNVSAIAKMKVPEIVTKQCDTHHKSQTESAICVRSSMAGWDMANLFYVLTSGQRSSSSSSGSWTDIFSTPKAKKPDFAKPDSAQVSTTDDGHPKTQCRLDTYFSGSLCPVSFSEDFSMDSPVPGACAEEKGDHTGVRPHCWYKPSR